MAYKFNSGLGGVICDQCKILIDQGLSYEEYVDIWGKSGDDGDFCMACKFGYESVKRKKNKNEK